jgi:hypothetical protein
MASATMLERAQHVGPLRQPLLDRRDEGVDAASEAVGRGRIGPRAAAAPVRARLAPLVAQRLELAAGGGVPGHEQRTGRIAHLEPVERAIHGAHAPVQRPRVAFGGIERHAITHHAHAPGLVDGRRAAFELPRHP